MVLERLFHTRDLLKRPLLSLVTSFIFVSVAVLCSLLLFPHDTGVYVIFFTTIPSLVVFLRALLSEEHICERCKKDIFSAYAPLLSLYTWFFIGLSLSFSFWYILLPPSISARLFSEQITTYNLVTGRFFDQDTFFPIVLHNLRLVFILLALSLLYSSGSLYLLILNASMVGVLIGQSVVSLIPFFTPIEPFGILPAFFAGLLLTLIRILPHGIFEFLGFFVASIAGGLLSVLFEDVREHRVYFGRETTIMVVDILLTIFGAVILIVLGAAIEASY